MISFMAVCLRSVHSLRFHSVQALRSFASLHSLHYPSLHSIYVHFTHLSTAQQNQFLLCITQGHHTCFPYHGIPIAKAHSQPSFGNAHATPSHYPMLLRSVLSLHLLLTQPHNRSGILYFFLRSVCPSPPTDYPNSFLH